MWRQNTLEAPRNSNKERIGSEKRFHEDIAEPEAGGSSEAE